MQINCKTWKKILSVFAIIPHQSKTRDLDIYWNLHICRENKPFGTILEALSCLMCHKLPAQKHLVLSKKDKLVSRCVSAPSKQNWPPQMHEAVCLSKARSALRWCLPWQLACTQQASTTGSWWPFRSKRCDLHLHIVLVLWMTKSSCLHVRCVMCVCFGNKQHTWLHIGRLAHLTTSVSAALITTSVCLLHGPAGLIWNTHAHNTHTLTHACNYRSTHTGTHTQTHTLTHTHTHTDCWRSLRG